MLQFVSGYHIRHVLVLEVLVHIVLHLDLVLISCICNSSSSTVYQFSTVGNLYVEME